MDNYTIFLNFENPRRGRQARNLSENDPKILDLKSSSEQIIFRKLSLGAPETYLTRAKTSSIMDLTSFGAQYGVKFLGKQSLVFGETDCSCVFFEESASQTRALSPVSTL